MKHEFIFKLNLNNLLYLHEEICTAINNKDANEIMEELKKLETQKTNCKNNRDYKQCEKRIKILEAVINFNCG